MASLLVELAIAAWAVPSAAQQGEPTATPSAELAPKPEPLIIEPADREAARLHAAGRAALAAKENDRARDWLRQALELHESADIAEDLGTAELALREYPGAATHLAWSIAHAATGASTEEAKKKFELARPYVAGVRLVVNVAGAKIHVDGGDVTAHASDALYYLPGSHVFEAFHPDYRDARKDMAVEAGKDSVVELMLEPRDGVGSGHPKPGLMGAGLGIGGAALVAGIVTGALSLGARGRAKDLQTDVDRAAVSCAAPPAGFAATCGDLESTLARRDALGTAAIVTLGVGGAVLLAAGLYIGISSSQRTSAAVAPLVERNAAGAVFSGSF